MAQLKTKMAGHLPLQDMIALAIGSTAEKLAAAESAEAEEKKRRAASAPGKKEVEKEEKEKEKESSAIDFSDPDQIEKLASAMEAMGDELIKTADEHNIGGESPQGGLVLPVASPNSGKQNYNLGQAKTGKVPMKTPEQGDPSQGPAKTQVENTASNPPGKTPYPAKGVLKTSAADLIRQELQKKAAAGGLAATPVKAPAVFKPVGEPTKVKVKAWIPGQGNDSKSKESMKKCSCADGKVDDSCPIHGKEKSSAVSFVLDRIKEAEARQGGLTLDTPSQDGPKPGGPAGGGNSARSNISSIEAAINLKKDQAKAPQKKMLDTVLTEKAQKKSTDPVLQDNLRNASKAGVKIAAAKAFLQKVAGLPEGDPRKEKLKQAFAKNAGKKGEEKKSSAGFVGTGSGGVPPVSGTPTPNAM